jgi:hypothetical protein
MSETPTVAPEPDALDPADAELPAALDELPAALGELDELQAASAVVAHTAIAAVAAVRRP